jgi:acylphosphatase
MSEKVQFHATVYGYVQGVSFRYYTLKQAQALGLAGLVRNLPDGTVEVIAQGARDAATQLLDWLHRGPSGAEVDHVDVEWQEPRGQFRLFEVRH